MPSNVNCVRATEMEPRSLDFVADACGGELRGGENPTMKIRRFSTDSRTTNPGDLFVAIPGDRFDGHDYVLDAVEKQAAAILVERSWQAPTSLPCPMIVAEDARAALGRIAAAYRRDFDLPIVAVAGSNGKTTTKDFLAAVLGARHETLSSEASFNNDIGVPLTLLRLELRHGVAVLEAGTNHPGELKPLLEMIAPRYGVLTGIGHEHLEFFGDLEGVANEEGALAESLPADGRLFVNGDSPCLSIIEKRCRTPLVRVGLSSGNEWKAEAIEITDAGTDFTVTSPEGIYDGRFHINPLGVHQVRNALLALAVGAELNVPATQARAALAACPPSKMRTQMWETGGVRVLDDAYNANTDSMRAALETLKELPCSGRRWAVLGDMAELGEISPQAHREVGRWAVDSGIDILMVTGRWSEFTLAGAREAGFDGGVQCASISDLIERLRRGLLPGDLVLIKASRSSGFEKVTASLQAGC